MPVILNITWHIHLTNMYMLVVTKGYVPLQVLFHHRAAECSIKTLKDESEEHHI
jgi:hypothetical protein